MMSETSWGDSGSAGVDTPKVSGGDEDELLQALGRKGDGQDV